MMRYIPAIDGLRALAVSTVLLYHAGVPGFAGGYVGVDVFFVVSGFIMTRLIEHESAAGNFTLLGFYERRIRRIFPALFLVMLATLVAGTVILLPPELARLGTSIVAATLFVSNLYFWRLGQDYLAGDLDREPFVHTWSLAIEEQFYILFPLLVVTLIRHRRRLGPAFLVLGCGSFALNAAVVATSPRTAFYFSACRAWELLLGAWIAVLPGKPRLPHRVASGLHSAGLAAILVAVLDHRLAGTMPWLAITLACTGTALVLAWVERPSWLAATLGHPLPAAVGLISYPLYLWHWPVLVLAKVWLDRALRPAEIALLLALAAILAVATWRLLERPVRARRVAAGRHWLFATAAGASCLALTLGGALRATHGLRMQQDDAVALKLAAADDYAPLLGSCHNWDRVGPDGLPRCMIGATDRNAVDFVLWGDSHAGAIAISVGAAGKAAGRKGLELTSDDCPPVLDTRVLVAGAPSDCEDRNRAAYELIRRAGIRRVILAGAWSQYLGGHKALRPNGEVPPGADDVELFRLALTRTIDRLKADRIDVVVLGPVPHIGWNVPTGLAMAARRHQQPRTGPSLEEFRAAERLVLDMLGGIAAAGVPVIYPHVLLCRPACMVELGGRVLYRDDEHLTTVGANLLRPQLEVLLARNPGAR